MRLLLIRHGQTKGSPEHRYLGTTDEPLSELGRETLQLAGILLEQEKPEAVYVTSKIRTMESAKLLFPQISPILTSGLEEMDFGLFEGKNYKDLEFDREYRKWVDSGCTLPCPEGESREEFCIRVIRSFDTLLLKAQREGKKSIAIVAHGGTWMAVMEHFCEEKRDYFDWNICCGGSFLVEAKDWGKNKSLRLLQTICPK